MFSVPWRQFLSLYFFFSPLPVSCLLSSKRLSFCPPRQRHVNPGVRGAQHIDVGFVRPPARGTAGVGSGCPP